MLEKSDSKIAILDANNFYVSCERLFNPKLNKQPTVVLSNNDGCVIARSQEIKDMGIKMGQPVFKLEDDVKDKMHKFSSNYVLYGDISDRIANILKRYTSKLEIYSIDESFMDLSHVPESELVSYAKEIKAQILRLTGIPISIGIAPNKTLAKLMNTFSKSNPDLEGVCSYWDYKDFTSMEVDEVWGVGDKWKKKLNSIGVNTISEFMNLPDYQVKKLFTIVGLRTWLELHGYLIHKVETEFKKPKVVTSSRSFGKTIWQSEQVSDAIWTFLEDACSKLKLEELKAKEITIFTTTDRFQPDFCVWSKKIRLYNPSNQIEEIWNEIYHHAEIPVNLWAKAGVILYNLIPENFIEPKLFHEVYEEVKKPNPSLQNWMTRRDFLSPEWTTNWNQIPKLS